MNIAPNLKKVLMVNNLYSLLIYFIGMIKTDKCKFFTVILQSL